MDKVQAIAHFWNSFDIPAYNENSVPDDAEMPYITFNVVTSDFGEKVLLYAYLWYRSMSWNEITKKMFEISNYIGRGGKMIETNDGGIWIKKDTQFGQTTSDEEDRLVKGYYLTIEVEFET